VIGSYQHLNPAHLCLRQGNDGEQDQQSERPVCIAMICHEKLLKQYGRFLFET
jgi:hypothetical protein